VVNATATAGARKLSTIRKYDARHTTTSMEEVTIDLDAKTAAPVVTTYGCFN
jgi:hypothetical protein